MLHIAEGLHEPAEPNYRSTPKTKEPAKSWPEFDLQSFAGSGAGLNRDIQIVLRASPAVSPATIATYDSGPVMWESAFFSKTSIQILAQTVTTTCAGWSVTCYGTHDMRALLMNQSPPSPETPKGFKLPATSWAQIAAPQSEDASPDAFAWSNPLTNFGQTLFSPEPWVAIRIVAQARSATGSIAVTATRIP